ncbi:hypothetical protein BN970_06966 [Mycolicibacterium conceptionense]|uniref:Uncharacterized protein n=2 Tax=Mycolicibacterium conceptionense TaxID=451644 RepID=A0A0U1E0V3_9MYCO|nr:hypothetical protein BN970_06966 [Mycolicibacterium conceptionense]
MMDPLSALSPALAGLSSLPQMMSGMGGGGLPIGDLGSMLGSLGGGLAGMAKDGFTDKPADEAPKSPEDGFKDEEPKKPEEPKEEFKDDKPQPAPPTNPADPLAGDPKAKNDTAPEAAAPEAGKPAPGEPDLTVKAGDEEFKAPDPTTKAVMDDVINKGMGVTAAYAAHNIQLPPPGTAVTAPVDPNMMKGGELGYFDAQEPILALGNRKIWLDGQVQPLSALGSRTDFLAGHRRRAHPRDPPVSEPCRRTPMQPEATTTEQTYVESSRDGALMVELDANEVPRVQIEPEVNATWTAEELSERVLHLYKVALMRVRYDALAAMNERGANIAPGTAAYPMASEIDEYRRRNINF